MEVINAKVATRQPNDKNDNFAPSVSSPYTLTVNEGFALVQLHDCTDDRTRYESLLKLPTKDLSQTMSIKSILEQMDAIQNQYIDLFVVVTFVRIFIFYAF